MGAVVRCSTPVMLALPSVCKTDDGLGKMAPAPISKNNWAAFGGSIGSYSDRACNLGSYALRCDRAGYRVTG
jgi:hypothetical protein